MYGNFMGYHGNSMELNWKWTEHSRNFMEHDGNNMWHSENFIDCDWNFWMIKLPFRLDQLLWLPLVSENSFFQFLAMSTYWIQFFKNAIQIYSNEKCSNFCFKLIVKPPSHPHEIGLKSHQLLSTLYLLANQHYILHSSCIFVVEVERPNHQFWQKLSILVAPEYMFFYITSRSINSSRKITNFFLLHKIMTTSSKAINK